MWMVTEYFKSFTWQILGLGAAFDVLTLLCLICTTVGYGSFMYGSTVQCSAGCL
jgi:hypothetical protein